MFFGQGRKTTRRNSEKTLRAENLVISVTQVSKTGAPSVLRRDGGPFIQAPNTLFLIEERD
jgi:hypothetical protein